MSKKRLEIKPGDVYGRLTILKEVDPHITPSGQKQKRVLVQCSCGNSEPFVVALNNLRKGVTTSCGCVRKEKLKETHKKNHKTNTYDLSGEYGIGYDSKGREFYFDLEDFDKIKDFCWCVDNNGYVITVVNKKTIQFHRLVTNCPEGKVVDHIDHSTTDNRKSNLRICSHSENMKNKSIYKRNKSGITGVSWDKASNKWRATITVNGKIKQLGRYINIEEATKARKDAEEKYFGEFANQTV